ncbi:MAG: hypothetical protein GXX86_12330, partial [Propionibacterium sp.]|nr:hypothetical protein [Propionibacterium sp.]
MRRLWGLLFALLCAALITAGVGLPAAAEEGEPGPPSDVASATPGPPESPEPVQTPDPPKAEPAESTPAAPDDERDEEPTPPTESRPQPSEPPSQSRTGTQSVAVTLTATTAGSTGVGWVANVWGTATGAPNSEVWTEVRLSDGRWSRSQIRTSDASGWYVIPLTYGQHSAGTQTFRVGVRSTDGVVYSANVTLTRVAISASTAGAAPVGAGANVWGTATGAPNAEVWTEVRLSDGRWSRSQIRTSNASGWYAIPLTYGQNSAGTQTFRVGTRTGAGVVYSSPVSLTRVSVSATTAGSRPVGVTTYVWGTAGGAPNSPVRTEVLIGGRWSRSQVGTTSATGYYALPLTYGQNNAGTYTYRVVVTVHGRDIASPSVLLTRTGSPSPVIP